MVDKRGMVLAIDDCQMDEVWKGTEAWMAVHWVLSLGVWLGEGQSLRGAA